MQFTRINKTSFIAGAGSAVLLGAALLPGLAGAQTATETPSATAEATGEAEGPGAASLEGIDCGPGLRGVFGLHVGEDLAAALGVTVEEIEAAKEQLQAERQAAAIARVNQALADGTITQERADALIERIESGERPFGRHGDRGFGGFGGPRGFGGFFGDSPSSVTPDA